MVGDDEQNFLGLYIPGRRLSEILLAPGTVREFRVETPFLRLLLSNQQLRASGKFGQMQWTKLFPATRLRLRR